MSNGNGVEDVIGCSDDGLIAFVVNSHFKRQDLIDFLKDYQYDDVPIKVTKLYTLEQAERMANDFMAAIDKYLTNKSKQVKNVGNS